VKDVTGDWQIWGKRKKTTQKPIIFLIPGQSISLIRR